MTDPNTNPSMDTNAQGSAADAAAEEAEQEAVFVKHLPEAKAVPASDVEPARVDPLTVNFNAKTGVAAVLAHRTEIEKNVMGIDWKAVAEVPEIALALIFAFKQAHSNTDSTLADDLKRMRVLRDNLLTSLQALASAGLIPHASVDPILKGRGSIDQAQDCVDAAALFRKYEAQIAGKHPVARADIDEAARLGNQVVQVLRPGSVKKTPQTDAELEEAINIRNRMWTLLEQRYDLVWRLGAWAFGRKVSSMVPSLHSAHHTTHKDKTATSQSAGSSSES